MKDANSDMTMRITGRLVRGYSAEEARRRNALSTTQPGLMLAAGDVVTVVDRFEGGRSFLVEFSRSRPACPDSCDWMGVIPAGDVELIGEGKNVE